MKPVTFVSPAGAWLSLAIHWRVRAIPTTPVLLNAQLRSIPHPSQLLPLLHQRRDLVPPICSQPDPDILKPCIAPTPQAHTFQTMHTLAPGSSTSTTQTHTYTHTHTLGFRLGIKRKGPIPMGPIPMGSRWGSSLGAETEVMVKALVPHSPARSRKRRRNAWT